MKKKLSIKLYILNLWTKFAKNWDYKYYKTIDYLPLFNFFKVIETNDYRYLLKLKDYEILPDTKHDLQSVWLDIQNQYSKADDSNYQIINFTQSKGLQQMQINYLVLWNLYNLMIVAPDKKETLKLKKEAGQENSSIKDIEKKLKSLRNKIELKKKDYEQKETKQVDFYLILDQISDIKQRTIDPFKTTVREYIAIRKNLKNGKRQNNTKGSNRPKGH